MFWWYLVVKVELCISRFTRLSVLNNKCLLVEAKQFRIYITALDRLTIGEVAGGRGYMSLGYGANHGCMTLITLSVWQSSGTSILSAQLHAIIPNLNKTLSADTWPTEIQQILCSLFCHYKVRTYFYLMIFESHLLWEKCPLSQACLFVCFV